MRFTPLPHHSTPRALAPSDARELLLAFDPARLDVPLKTRRAAALWASHWMDAQPDATILIACNARARNREQAHRALRLRRLVASLERHGVPGERIRYTTSGLKTPVCEQAGERGLAWFKVCTPIELERGVLPIEALFATPEVPHANRHEQPAG